MWKERSQLGGKEMFFSQQILLSYFKKSGLHTNIIKGSNWSLKNVFFGAGDIYSNNDIKLSKEYLPILVYARKKSKEGKRRISERLSTDNVLVAYMRLSCDIED